MASGPSRTKLPQLLIGLLAAGHALTREPTRSHDDLPQVLENNLATKNTKGTKQREAQPWFFFVSFVSFVSFLANSFFLLWPPIADFTNFPDSQPI